MIATSLEELLAPTALSEFAQCHFARLPLFVPGKPDRGPIDKFLSQCQVAVGSGRLRHPSVQLSKGGEWLAPGLYTQSVDYGSCTFHGITIPTVLRELMDNGATLVLSAAQRYSAQLRLLCEDLTRLFHRESTANLYVTPPHAEGFPRHSDRHHVFAIQLVGSKIWELMRDAEADATCITLNAGDLLYVPQGYVHAAKATGLGSVHISVSAPVITFADILRLVVDENTSAWDLKSSPGLESLLSDDWSRLSAQRVKDIVANIGVDTVKSAVENDRKTNLAFPQSPEFRWL